MNLEWMESGNVDMPLQFAVFLLYGISGAALLGLLVLFALKLRHIAADRRTARCLHKYRDYLIYLQAHGEEEERLKLPYGNPTQKEKQILQQRLFELMDRVTGVHRQKLITLCQDMGLEQYDLKRLQSGRKWTRIDAAYNLGMMRSEQAVPGMLQLLKNSPYDPTIFILARAIAKSAVRLEDLREMVKSVMAHGKNCQQLLVDILHDSPLDTGPLFASFLQEADEKLVKVGLIGLSSHTHLDQVPQLQRLVNSQDKEIRIKVAKLLCRDVRCLTEANVKLFMNHPDWEIRAVAAKAIGALGLSEYIPLLKQATGDSNWWVSYNSTNSLAQLQVPGFVALCEILNENREGSRKELALQVIQNELENGRFYQSDRGLLQDNTKRQLEETSGRRTAMAAHAMEK